MPLVVSAGGVIVTVEETVTDVAISITELDVEVPK